MKRITLYFISILVLCSVNLDSVQNKNKKIVGLVPARNEKHTIGTCLKVLSLYTDAIVYLDDASDDNTVSVVESLAADCNIEKIIKKPQWYRDEPGDRNKLLQIGRQIGGTHFIVIDSDEIFTANCLDKNFLRNKILDLRPGERLKLNWIQLWRGIDKYRFDTSVWTWNYKDFIFCDDGVCSYNSEFIHTPRTPNNLKGKTHTLTGYQYGVMHFQFVNWRNLLIKQAWYRCLERIRDPKKPVYKINQRYAASKNENKLSTKIAPHQWFNKYNKLVNLQVYEEPEYWRERQIINWFKTFGKEYFKDLDIWDIDWQFPTNETK